MDHCYHHVHNFECKHESLQYCTFCGKVFCTKCGREWEDKCNLNHYYPYIPFNPITITTPSPFPTWIVSDGQSSGNTIGKEVWNLEVRYR